MEVQEPKTQILTDDDFSLVERLTDELINKALDLCDEKLNCSDDIEEYISDLPSGGDRDTEETTEPTSEKKTLKFSAPQNSMVRSISVDVGSFTFSHILNAGENYITPGWRSSLRRTQSEAALSLVDEDTEVEYLKRFDPFKGNLDVVSPVNEVLATSANKHPAEETSFLRALEEMSDADDNEDCGSINLEDSEIVRRSQSVGDSDCGNETVVASEVEEDVVRNPADDSVTYDANDRMMDDTSDGLTDYTNDRMTNDTSDGLTDYTNDRMTNDTSDGVTNDTSDGVTNDTSDGVTNDTSDITTDNTNDRIIDDTIDRVTDDGFTAESISTISIPNIEASKDNSTFNHTTSNNNHKTDQDTFAAQHIIPYPTIECSPLNTLIIDNEHIIKNNGRPNDLEATNHVQRLELSNETSSDILGNLSFLSTDSEANFSSFSSAEKFVREVLGRSRSSSSTSSPKKSCGAAINADSRMYNTLTFLDNDDSDDGEGGTERDRKNTTTTTTEGNDANEQLDNHKQPSSDVNDNPRETDEENGSSIQPTDSEPAAAKKKIVPNFELLKCDDLDLNFSPRGDSVPDLQLGEYYNDHTPDDDFDSPDDLANPVFDSIEDWADDLNDPPVEPIPEYTAREEYEDVRNWRPVQIAGISYRIDMRAIEPYKKVLSHGGYYGNGLNAIVVFAACYLPDRSRLDYRYIMDNLFLYVVSVLELLVVEDYMIIYFHAAASRNKVPALRWLKRCYDMIDHRLRKNLQRLLVVHPTFFLKTVVIMTKPFISSKFSSKLNYVRSLAELTRLVPTEYIHLPDEVKEVDRSLNPSTPAPQKKFVNL